MAFINIGNYLERFKGLRPPKEFIKSEIIKIIKDIFDISLDSKEIDCRAGAIFIKTKNPALKNEIFIKKEKILGNLKEKLGNQTPRDIRFS